MCQRYVPRPVFAAVDLCRNIFERQLSFLFGKFPRRPPLLKLQQKASRGLIDGGIEVERRGGHSESEGLWAFTEGAAEAFYFLYHQSSCDSPSPHRRKSSRSDLIGSGRRWRWRWRGAGLGRGGVDSSSSSVRSGNQKCWQREGKCVGAHLWCEAKRKQLE